MREIKFRGKEIETNQWVYGSLVQDDYGNSCIVEFVDHHEQWYDVIPSTVGQFTGLKDKHGKEIYEGDIYKNVITGMRYVIEWQNDTSSFISRITGTEYHYWLVRGYFDDLEYAGNIHDNPKLLKEGDE